MKSSLCCSFRNGGLVVAAIQIVEATLFVCLAILGINEIIFLQSEEVDHQHKANHFKTLKALKLVSFKTSPSENLVPILIGFVTIDFLFCVVRVAFAAVLFFGILQKKVMNLNVWIIYKIVDVVFTVVFSPILFFLFHLPLKIKPSYNWATITTVVAAVLLGTWFIKIIYDFRKNLIDNEEIESKKSPINKL